MNSAMTTTSLLALAGRREVVIGGLVLAVLTLVWIARRIRRIAKSERPDEPLATLAMLIGLGWSSEAMWQICRARLHLPLGLTLLLFVVFESLLVLAMLRAKRHVREFGWPGRFGTTAWIVAGAMSTVAAFASHSLAEAALRIAIPLLVTKQWWDGLVGGSARRPVDATSWRWTPRRVLLALGAIEPGERDVETVHRERLTQQMTQLEHRRRHGSSRLAGRRAGRLARLSLTADDEMIAEVRRRVDRASWFEPTQAAGPPAALTPAVAGKLAASGKHRRVRHHRLVRSVRVTHPAPKVIAAQEPRQDPRASHEIDLVVRAVKDQYPKIPQRRIAHLAAVSEPTVRRALRRTQTSAPDAVNGSVPELEGARR